MLKSLGRRRDGTGRVRRWVGWLAAGLFAVLAAPHLLLLIYAAVPPPVTPLMTLRLFEGESIRKQWTPLDRLPAHLAYAVVAAEDNRFCEHSGVDWRELNVVIEQFRAGEPTRGASTITMQTVKNLILWPGRDPLRKAIEIYFAKYLDLIWSKRRIMEVYLNIVEWDNGVYGAQAAARHHFQRDAAELTPAQAALLAATLPNPRVWNAGNPGPYVSGRSSVIRRRIDQLGPLLDCVRPD